MFLVILPIFEGFAILLLPLLLGTREMPFPRLGAFSYWTFLFGGLLYYSSTLFQAVPDAGWFAYTPLSRPGVLTRPGPGLLGAGAGRGRGRGHRRRHRDHHRRAEDAGAGDDPQPHPAVRLGGAGDGVHDPVRLHHPDHRQPAAGAGPGLRHPVLQPPAGRQLAAVAAPVLDLRPPRGLHPVRARHRGGLDDRGRPSPGSGSSATPGRSAPWSPSGSCRSACGPTTCSPSGCRRWC